MNRIANRENSQKWSEILRWFSLDSECFNASNTSISRSGEPVTPRKVAALLRVESRVDPTCSCRLGGDLNAADRARVADFEPFVETLGVEEVLGSNRVKRRNQGQNEVLCIGHVRYIDRWPCSIDARSVKQLQQ